MLRSFTFVLLLLSFAFSGIAARYEAGESVTMSKKVGDDLYAMGGSVNISAPVMGDLLSMGGEITLSDSVRDDLFLMGGEVTVNGPVEGDVRVMGGQCRFMKSIGGDLLVFGGEVDVDQTVDIKGDLLVFGGSVHVNGNVDGKVTIKGGKVTLSGQVRDSLSVQADRINIQGDVLGFASIGASHIDIGNKASFDDDLRYWNKQEKLKIKEEQVLGTFVLDDTLKPHSASFDWKYFVFGSFVFWTLYSISVVLMLLLISLLFRRFMGEAGNAVNERFFMSFVYGLLYFLALPIATGILLVTVIGIPIGLVTGALFGFSILFSHLITAVVFTHWIKYRYNKNWGKGTLFGISLASFLILKLISLIPILGWLIAIFLVCTAFGGMLMSQKGKGGELQDRTAAGY